jgi:putative iron-only hydrogenase system regulator
MVVMQKDICVVGILVDGRADRAPEVQQVLTRHGSRILSRSGIPDPSRRRGIITLTVEADESERKTLERDLQQIEGVVVKSVALGPALM